jgi:ATP-dependent exoDNAse (exonuclease V) alpha subunit
MSHNKKISFAPTAEKALELMNTTKKNIFLTGRAGTGKSTLLDFFRENTQKKIVILAPTGVSAVNVQGETIHAFFGLKPGFELPEAKKLGKPKNPSLYKRVETLVIDEISMVRADLMDAMDIFLRNVRKTPEPFGGVQIIFIGDLYQLPPVLTNHDKKIFYEEYGYKGEYFFDSEVFQRDDFFLEFIELEKIYRQKDLDFIHLLNAVRDNTINYSQITELNKSTKTNFVPDKDSGFISLCTTNKDANYINEKNLAEIELPEYFSDGRIEGKVEKNQFPAEELLILKEGAQVIFLNNDSERRWVNGSIGKVIFIDKTEDILEVEVNGKTHNVEPHSWEISKYVMKNGNLDREILGSFTQFPVKLAWAITIHKSQGKTFDKVLIDFGRGTFAHGQAYVALSRCTSFDGMIMKRNIRKSDVKMDRRVQQFFARFHYHLSAQFFSEKKKEEVLHKAIDENRTLKISYQKSPEHKSLFRIQPYELQDLQHNEIDFKALLAYSYDEEKEMQMSLARILWLSAE